ncbi:MAG TPA: cellulase [Bacteroidales bacterium]|nr:cellulase [Bacteroidales bacterium]
MDKFLKKIPRILYVFIALIIGFLIVMAIATISKDTAGPIGSLLNRTSTLIGGIEENAILKQRENRRAEKLNWFTAIRDDKSNLINSKIILLGASDNTQIDSYEKIINLEDSLRTTFPIIHIYRAWGEKREHEFPMIEAETIYGLGSIPMITWEPWVGAFSLQNYPNIEPSLEKRDKGCLAAIAKGDYDSYIVKWALEAKKFAHPIYIRFGHEMNDPYHYPWGPQNNFAQDYINAWHHVHGIFEENQVDNIIWVWNPHLSYDFEGYYPGDRFVDVISFGVLNFGTSLSWSKWWSFDELLSNSYELLSMRNKPMMISEFGSLSIGGERSEWFKQAISSIPKDYPAINSIIFFHYSNETSTDKSLDWYIVADQKVTKELITQMNLWPDSVRAAK